MFQGGDGRSKRSCGRFDSCPARKNMKKLKQLQNEILKEFVNYFPTKEQVIFQMDGSWDFTLHFDAKFKQAIKKARDEGIKIGIRELIIDPPEKKCMFCDKIFKKVEPYTWKPTCDCYGKDIYLNEG